MSNHLEEKNKIEISSDKLSHYEILLDINLFHLSTT